MPIIIIITITISMIILSIVIIKARRGYLAFRADLRYTVTPNTPERRKPIAES